MLIPDDPPTPEATAWQAEDRGRKTEAGKRRRGETEEMGDVHL
ncbi:MAG: hypothetical protein PVH99_05915 [Desulfobacteraceae bacterium]|jgi:hypothetical protein